jgi:UPF0755 protein
MPVKELADTLAHKGVIRDRLWFSIVAWRDDYKDKLVPGRYRLRQHSSERQVLRVLARKEQARLLVTIPEGLTMSQTAAVLARQRLCDTVAFLRACTDTALLQSFGIPSPTAEGFLFPETYELSTAMSATDIVRILLREFTTVLDSLVRSDSSLVISAGHDRIALNSDRVPSGSVVTLASIVEKEAQVPEEYPIIAGVFANRLRRGMPLQSCATVEYVLGQHREVLSTDDTKTPSPWNTYLHAGLPPGPICSPGRRSLAAALAPARHDYLYFVARGDGSHTFSRTFAEHSAACRRLSSPSP